MLSPELAVSMIAALAGLWQVYVAKHPAAPFKKTFSAVDGSRPYKKNELFVVDDAEWTPLDAAGNLKWFHYTAA
jgi:hypothetical protein